MHFIAAKQSTIGESEHKYHSSQILNRPSFHFFAAGAVFVDYEFEIYTESDGVRQMYLHHVRKPLGNVELRHTLDRQEKRGHFTNLT